MDAKLTKRQRLERAVLENMSRAIKQDLRWGFDDCVLWAVEPIRQVLGYDPAANGRGRYKTKIGAARVLGRGGIAGAIRSAARRHHWTMVAPRHARAGDVGIATIDGVNSMVCCRAHGWFVVRGESGFSALRARHVRMAWRVI